MGAMEDRARFEALYDEQYERCTRLALRIVHDRAVAEELASEAFARAWARWRRLGRDPRAAGWVLRVTTNLAIDVTRKRQAIPQPAIDLTPADHATMRVALVQALQTLPRRQRETIALRYLADLSESDVSAALGLSTGSVKTHLHRGLARLRDSMGSDEEEVRLVHGS
jgi:RNA polymerase sigma factor (sigma-70 family)